MAADWTPEALGALEEARLGGLGRRLDASLGRVAERIAATDDEADYRGNAA